MSVVAIEKNRLEEQIRLDSLKGAAERNRLGQFATPPELAIQIMRYLCDLWKERTDRIRFIDPAIGTGSFYSALRQMFEPERIECGAGIELDPDFADAAQSLWGDMGLQITTGDFTHQSPPAAECRFNLVVTNPPYVRHHHLLPSDKRRLKAAVKGFLGLDVSGLAGLYAYFLLLSHEWLDDDGIGVWLIPSEFMDVNYGRAVKDYLMRRVRLLHIHRFRPSDVQFCDALVTSAIVVFQKSVPSISHKARFTLGGSMLSPELSDEVPITALCARAKWTAYPQQMARGVPASSECTTLGELFSIKRGIATGANGFFILPRQEAIDRGFPSEAIWPILPSPRYLDDVVIERESDGWPSLRQQLALIDCHLPEQEIRHRFPELWSYLESGIRQGVHEGYLASRRVPWYSQEHRDPALFLCTYMGRNGRDSGPFRLIWNKSDAKAANVYLLLYPKGLLKEALKKEPKLCGNVFEALRTIAPGDFVSEGRVYGGGLHKVEPKELASVSARTIVERIKQIKPVVQLSLAFTS